MQELKTRSARHQKNKRTMVINKKAIAPLLMAHLAWQVRQTIIYSELKEVIVVKSFIWLQRNILMDNGSR